MAQNLSFDAILVDAISAPLNAIADNLIKVSDAVNAMSQIIKDGFDASTAATTTLNTTMSGLVKTTADNTAAVTVLGDTIDSTLVPSIDNLASSTDLSFMATNSLTRATNDQIAAATANTTALDTSSVAVMDATVATDALTTSTLSSANNMAVLQGVLSSTAATLDANTVSVDASTLATTDLAVATLDQTAATALQQSATQNNTQFLALANTALQANTNEIVANTAAEGLNTSATNTNSTALNNFTGTIGKNSNALRDNKVATEESAAEGEASAGERSGGYGSILGATMLLGMAGAAVKLGVDLIKSGADSEAALNRVAAMTGASAQEMDQFKSSIEKLAPVAGKTVGDLAGGLYDIVSVGYKGEGAMNVLTEAAKAAAAGGTDLHTVTNGLSGIMTAYGATADEAAHYTDVLLTGVRTGKADFADYSRAIGLVGLVSHEANFSIEGSAAALSTMTAVYPGVRQAGQNLQTLIQSVGISYADVEKRVHATGAAFDDNAFQAAGLRDRLQKVWEASNHNDEAFKKLLGNVTDLKGAMALLDNGAQNYDRNLGLMSDASNGAGTTANAFATHLQTMKAHLESVQGALSVVAMKVATLAEPAINAGLSILSQIFTKLANEFETHANIMTPLLIGLAVVIGSTLVGAIAALLSFLGPMLAEAFAVAAPFIAAGVAIAGFIALIRAAYESSPVLRDALGQLWDKMKVLGALIASDVAPLLQRLVGGIKDAGGEFKNLFGYVQPVTYTFQTFGEQARIVHGHLVRVRTEVDGVGTRMQAVRGPLSFVVDIIHLFGDGIQRLIGFFQQFQPHVEKVTSTVQSLDTHAVMIHGHLVLVHEVISTVTSKLVTVHDAGQKVSDIFHKITGALGNLLGPMAGVTAGLGVLKIAWELFHNAKVLTFLIRFGITIAHYAIEIGAFVARVQAAGGIFEFFGSAIATAAVAAAPFIAIALGVAIVVAAVVVAFQHLWATSAMFRSAMRGVLDSLKEVWAMLQGQFKNVLNELHAVFVNNLLPAWKSLQDGFEAAKPYLIALGAVIIPLIVLAIGILVGVLHAVVTGIVSLITALARFIGGIAQMLAGVFQLFGAIFGGIVKIIVDLFKMMTGQNVDFGKDLHNIWNGIWNGLQNIVFGLVTAVSALFQGLFGTILGMIGSFVGSFLGFFGHIFDKMVGHSIIPDLVTGVISWIVKMVTGIPLHLAELVVNFLMKMGQLEVQGLLIVGRFILSIIQFFIGLPGKILGAIGGLVSQVPALLENMGKAAISAAANMATGVINNFLHMKTGAQLHTEAMKAATEAKMLEMKAVSLGHTEQMAMQSIKHMETMRQGLIEKIVQTKDPVERAHLEMQLQAVDQSMKKEQGVVQAADRERKQVIAAAEAKKARAIELEKEAKEGVLGHVGDMVGQVLGNIGNMHDRAVAKIQEMVTNLINKAGDLKDKFISKVGDLITNITTTMEGLPGKAIQWGINLITGLANGITGAAGKVTGAVANVAKGIFNFLGHGSPTKEGPGATSDTWMPNLVNMMTHGLEAGAPSMQNSASKLAMAIHNGIMNGVGTGSPGSASLGLRGQIPNGSTANGTAIKEFHMHLEGGMGTGFGLASMNPADRQRLIKQIADEMGRQLNMQGRSTAGYTGY